MLTHRKYSIKVILAHVLAKLCVNKKLRELQSLLNVILKYYVSNQEV